VNILCRILFEILTENGNDNDNNAINDDRLGSSSFQ
jgi:hypothetical protein